MPPRMFQLLRRLRGPRSAPTDAAPSSASPEIATSHHPNPPIPQLFQPPQQPYSDSIQDGAGGSHWDAALALPSILTDIRSLPPGLVGPLSQVADVVSSTVEAVKLMRENKDECAHLLSRVVRHLRALVATMRGSNVSFTDGTPIAVCLIALKSNLMAIRDDAERWSRLSILDSLFKRERIKTAILMHRDNLNDCFAAFQMVAAIKMANYVDRADASAVSGAQTATTAQSSGEGGQETFDDASSIYSTSVHDLLQRPAGQAIFEQIGVAIQGRLEEIGLQSISKRPGPGSPAVIQLHTAYDRDVWYLSSQISELTLESRTILSDIAVNTGTGTQPVGWETHRPQTGDPTRQLRETVMMTMQLLIELRSIGEKKVDATMLADKMLELSLNLGDLGLWDEGFAVGTIAMVLCRAGQDMVRIAMSLNGLSHHLSRLGRWEEALEIIEEAVSIFRKLAADRPDAFLPDLAHSLNTLSNRLSGLGRREESLQMIEESVSVSIHRKLAADRPDAFLPDLAHSLNTLSNCLSDLGRWEQVPEIIEEAMSIFRKLAADRPDAFLPDLARSLNTLSNRLSDLGRWEQTLEIIEEAMSIFRKLAADRPDAFLPDLARSLNTLSNRLSGLGRREESLQMIEESVSIHRKLAADRPDAFLPDLARSLNTLSNRLSGLGRREESLQMIEESVSIHRKLAADQPDAFLPDLARSLNTLSNRLSGLGRREESLQMIEESVSIHRKLAADRPDAFLLDLARSLNTLSDCLPGLGRREESLQMIEESVSIHRKLAADRPDVKDGSGVAREILPAPGAALPSLELTTERAVRKSFVKCWEHF
ncbi:hypothetical protein F5887DRAFT_350425 [Amanita rubescens]|nr:hypothetical protein F5887DRAFT_350425 [Amanita rubescens]